MSITSEYDTAPISIRMLNNSSQIEIIYNYITTNYIYIDHFIFESLSRKQYIIYKY